MEALTRARYIHCGCGRVFHRDTAGDDLAHHLATTGHESLTSTQVELYVDRKCVVCRERRGSYAMGCLVAYANARVMSTWVCGSCVDRATGVAHA